MSTLKIHDLHVSVDDKEILKGVNLEISSQEVVALLGPNGHGKSTLLATIMGHPSYKVLSGSIYFDDINVLDLPVDMRSKLGLFYAMQSPSEISGVNNSDFLRLAVNAHLDKPVSTYQFYKLLNQATEDLKIPFDMATRYLNEGFSGGEKKRNEILQLTLLNPKIAMLDEIDSGLDVDAIQIVSNVLNKQKEKGMGLLIVSHYARLYDLVKPTRAVIMIDGKIVCDGGNELIKRIDETGYEWLKTEYGIDIEKNNTPNVSIGSCAIKDSVK